MRVQCFYPDLQPAGPPQLQLVNDSQLEHTNQNANQFISMKGGNCVIPR